MKKPILNLVTTLSIILGLSIAGFGGISTRVTADVPFDFMVGNKKFSPGKYSINRSTNTQTLVINDSENKGAAVFLVQNASPRSDAKAMFVFNRYGDQYFLSQVWDGSEAGSVLAKSKAERKAAKSNRDTITQNSKRPETVTIIAQTGN
ncbi:MAG: hypothetical protein L0220_02070 [Acidobacteria bacterium]|nr:hypothetical protein [Acidobacteriota bacterium]